MRYAVLVTGPAGAGKSTFTKHFMTHLQTMKRTAHLVNFDPAAHAESFEYQPTIDIKDLINLDDVMDELQFGPNGGLVYCFEYLLQNMDWLEEELGNYEDDYLIFDCPGADLSLIHTHNGGAYYPLPIFSSHPGQIELYTHHPFLPTLVQNLSRQGIRTSAVYLLESQFMEDRYKFFSGVLSAMSAMVNLEIPWINIMSKMDLISPSADDSSAGARNGIRGRKNVARFLDPDPMLLATTREEPNPTNARFHSLNQAIVQLIEDHPLVSFLPLDLSSTDSLNSVISHIDYCMQYGEDEEPKEPRDLDGGDFSEM